MKFLKWLLALLGIAALIAAGALLYMSWLDLRSLWAAIRTYNNAGLRNPMRNVFLMAGLASLGGLLLGWGLGLPSRTGRSVRNAYKRDLEAQGIAVDPEDRRATQERI
ncbi:hypothetical protein [Luteococcus peritonei]|uniref:DUF1049 domain-containing protein n=1 Tax=Luteococcus peritonei TaxID=88874 RepID=A0ABW4RYY3_9ACTN